MVDVSLYAPFPYDSERRPSLTPPRRSLTTPRGLQDHDGLHVRDRRRSSDIGWDDHLHEREGLSSADDDNPFGTNGMFTQVMEHIPLLNNMIQENHRTNGDDMAAQRAAQRNPIGADGVVTQIGEHIPLVCDGIEALHRINHQHNAAERAGARTLKRLLSKDGAVTKVAELFPGINLMAAMMHEFNGNHNEAVRALNIFDNWTLVGEPDGPLAKVAELFPGMDLVAFGLHVQSQQYPQALRCITKTKWMDLEVRSVRIFFSAPDGESIRGIHVMKTAIRNVDVVPRGLSLIVGLNDVLTSFLELDNEGNLRPRSTPIRRQSSDAFSPRHTENSSATTSEDFGIAGSKTEELVSEFLTALLKRMLNRMTEDIPMYVQSSVDAVNEYTVPRMRSRSWKYFILFKESSPAMPSFPAMPSVFVEAVQEAFPRASLRHHRLPSVEERVLLPPLTLTRKDRNVPEKALAVTGVVAAGCCGGKLGVLACFGGIIAGATVACRSMFRAMHEQFNEYNTEAWEPHIGKQLARPLASPGSPRNSPASRHLLALEEASTSHAFPKDNETEKPRSSSTSTSTTLRPRSRLGTKESHKPEDGAVYIEFDREVVSAMVDVVVHYLLTNIRCGCVLLPVLRALKPCLQAMVRGWGPQWTTVPFVLDLETGDMEVEVQDWPTPVSIPNLRLALVCDLNTTGSQLSEARLVLPDRVIDEVLDSVRLQIQALDLRKLDDRLDGFTQPLKLNFDLSTRWCNTSELKMELTNLRCTIHLPD